MFKLTLAGFAAVIALGLASAVVTVANAPAMSGAPGHEPDVAGTAVKTAIGTVGRLVLTFEPATPQIDRN